MSRARGDSNGARRVPQRRHQAARGTRPGYERSEYLRVSPPANLRLHLLVSLHTRSQVLSVSRGYGAGRLERSQARTGPRPQGAGGTRRLAQRRQPRSESLPAGKLRLHLLVSRHTRFEVLAFRDVRARGDSNGVRRVPQVPRTEERAEAERRQAELASRPECIDGQRCRSGSIQKNVADAPVTRAPAVT